MLRQVLEVFLVELILFLLLWLAHSFLATYLTIVCSVICLAILVIAQLAELFEKSKIAKVYYWIMFVSIFTPWIAFALITMLSSIQWAI